MIGPLQPRSVRGVSGFGQGLGLRSDESAVTSQARFDVWVSITVVILTAWCTFSWVLVRRDTPAEEIFICRQILSSSGNFLSSNGHIRLTQRVPSSLYFSPQIYTQEHQADDWLKFGSVSFRRNNNHETVVLPVPNKAVVRSCFPSWFSNNENVLQFLQLFRNRCVIPK